VLNFLWPIFIIVSYVYAMFNGNIESINNGIFESTESAINLTITLFGTMCLWNGLMEIASNTKLINRLTKLLRPIVNFLFKDSKNSRVYISDEAQKGYTKIITTYSVVEKNIEQNFSILDITLHTGKTHQIRAHLAHIGLPIIGDGKYGNNKINKQFSCKTQQLCSYCLKFNFSNDAGILNYLNNKIIKMKTQCNF